MKSGENEEWIGKGSHGGPAGLPAYLREHSTLTLCTMPRKALILSALSTLAMTFPTPALDLTTAVGFTTDLNSAPDWSLEKTQAFQRHQTLPASWTKSLRPHTITAQFTWRAASVRIILMSLLIIMTGAPAQPNTSMESDCKSQIKTYFSHILRSSEVGLSRLSQCPRNPDLKWISVCLQTGQKLWEKLP